MINYELIRMLMSTKDPEELYNRMMKENPQFKAFVEQNQGKNPEQIAKENGIDLNTLLCMMR